MNFWVETGERKELSVEEGGRRGKQEEQQGKEKEERRKRSGRGDRTEASRLRRGRPGLSAWTWPTGCHAHWARPVHNLLGVDETDRASRRGRRRQELIGVGEAEGDIFL